ncbi:uncharacterized protein MONOS_3827 [Monocercomonoides exilis]|uniref:uncharacterized protein n=1 Tax=Monocercomonoides exilis TaxID=2049356 RepID=UPI0035598C6A|nr:hypothetical protein MONOS_3827 [Monocercomonoides exilis]|eukprot:MONOS_3827.1-p1 / transcript=MONOS_3827.1 / gene=MONOS_3827 / organism=Monocercomonoides_exilis_PA203 / gene_product=unspecified product / transcript_product=unspecified product / location=Mono_scaffold00094:50339-57456(-) / protein_length=2318 / sequence_SO=supercontig / SO=protein_coding / is_pseudo=false
MNRQRIRSVSGENAMLLMEELFASATTLRLRYRLRILYSLSAHPQTMESCTFDSCSTEKIGCYYGGAGNDGGGILMLSTNPENGAGLVNSMFIRCSCNSDEDGTGGGFDQCSPSINFPMSNCGFFECHSEYSAGAVINTANVAGNDIVLFNSTKNNIHSSCITTTTANTVSLLWSKRDDRSSWLKNEGGSVRFVSSEESQLEAKDTAFCGFYESYPCSTINHCISQMIDGIVEEISVLPGVIVEEKEVGIGDRTITIHGSSSSGSFINTRFEEGDTTLFGVDGGSGNIRDLSILHNTDFTAGRNAILFEIRGCGIFNLSNLNISMNAAHSRECCLFNSLMKLNGGQMIMETVKWDQTFSDACLIALSQNAETMLLMKNCTFSDIVRISEGASLVKSNSSLVELTMEGCTISRCGSTISENGGALDLEVGASGCLKVEDGEIHNCFASAITGRGGGLFLTISDESAEYSITASFSDNEARWGSDLFVDSVNLKSTATGGKISSLTASNATINTIRGFDGGDERVNIPLCVYLIPSPKELVVSNKDSFDHSYCGFVEFPCLTLKHTLDKQEGEKKVCVSGMITMTDEVELEVSTCTIRGQAEGSGWAVVDDANGVDLSLVKVKADTLFSQLLFSLPSELQSHKAFISVTSAAKLTMEKCSISMQNAEAELSFVFMEATSGFVNITQFVTNSISLASFPLISLGGASTFGTIDAFELTEVSSKAECDLMCVGNGASISVSNSKICAAEVPLSDQLSSFHSLSAIGGKAVSLKNCSFLGFSSLGKNGGAVECVLESGCSFEVIGGLIENGRSIGGNGGGVFVEMKEGSLFSVGNVSDTETKNEEDSDSGRNGVTELKNCNSARSEEGNGGNGGGLYLLLVGSSSNFILKEVMFEECHANAGQNVFVSSEDLSSVINKNTLEFNFDLNDLTQLCGCERGTTSEDGVIPLVLYFWTNMSKEAHAGGNKSGDIAICGFAEYPCATIEKALKRLGESDEKKIVVRGYSEMRSEVGLDGSSTLTSGNDEVVSIAFSPNMKGLERKVVWCHGNLSIEKIELQIPLSFENGADVLIFFDTSDGNANMKECCFEVASSEIGYLDYSLLIAPKGNVFISSSRITNLKSQKELIAITTFSQIDLWNATARDVELKGKSAISIEDANQKGRIKDNVENEWNIIVIKCSFEHIKQNGSQYPSLIEWSGNGDAKMKIENSTMTDCGSEASSKGGGILFSLSEGGWMECVNSVVLSCFCSSSGRGGGLYLKNSHEGEMKLNFILSDVIFLGNKAFRGRDVYVQCQTVQKQVGEEQFMLDFRSPFVKDLAMWGCSEGGYATEEDLLLLVVIYRSETIFVSGATINSSNTKQCGEIALPCSSLDVGARHVIGSQYSQILVEKSTTLENELALRSVSVKSFNSEISASVIVEGIIGGNAKSVISVKQSITFERICFDFGEIMKSEHKSLILAEDGRLRLYVVEFRRKESEEFAKKIDVPLRLVEANGGSITFDSCTVSDLSFQNCLFHFAEVREIKMSELNASKVIAMRSIIECTECESVIISKQNVNEVDVERGSWMEFADCESGAVNVSLVEIKNITNQADIASGMHFMSTSSMVELSNCSFVGCKANSHIGKAMMIAQCNNVFISSCILDGEANSGEERKTNEEKLCRWNGSLLETSRSNVVMRDTIIANSSVGGLSISSGSMKIEKGEFKENNPSIANYPSARRNIVCNESGMLHIQSLKDGDGLKDNSSLWILNEGCELQGIVEERSNSLFIPVLGSVEAEETGDEIELIFKGQLLLPCDLSFWVAYKTTDSELVEDFSFVIEGYESENEVHGRVPSSQVQNATNETEVSVGIYFGNPKSSTEPFALKNRSETNAKGDERIVEGGNEKKSWWVVIVIVMTIVLFVVLMIAVISTVRWRKQKRRTEELEVIVEDTVRKDPKAFEMVTMEMSPEEQWRRAEREAEKKNEERIKKRMNGKQMVHSESEEHLLSESGSTEYILGRDSDKIPDWALEKEDEEEIRKRSPSPSISSTTTTSTTDSDSTFVRGEDLCPTTSSMSNLVDVMACSSPHEKLIVDLRDSLFMLLHGRNKTKEMAIGTLQEREMTAAQILFWVANLALHSFDEMENKLQSLSSLSPHIVLFSEHMVICIVMHSGFLSSDDSDSSSISSLTVVSSSSNISVMSERFTGSPPPSSAFEDDDDIRKECLRWKAPELQMNKKMGATKESVAFSIGMMLWEYLTLEIPFGEYECVVAGQKIVNGERPNFRKAEESKLLQLIKACFAQNGGDRPTLTHLKREFIQLFPSGAAVLTMSDAIDLEESREGNDQSTTGYSSIIS